MIRLRIERFTVSEIIYPHDDTLIWFEDGQPVGRAIIESLDMSGDWVPVEVIDE